MNLFALSDTQALSLAKATPCFVYSLEAAANSAARLAAVLPPRVRLAYAVKANPHPAILRIFAKARLSFDCASAGELRRVARALGPMAARSERVLLGGPGKSRSDLALALSLRARIQVDGMEDLNILNSLLRDRHHRGAVQLNLRVHPSAGCTEGSGVIGGDAPSAFGVDEEYVDAFLNEARRYPWLRLKGLQMFAVGNELDHNALLCAHRKAMSLARDLSERIPGPLDMVDLGGGLGIPYAESDKPLDIETFGQNLQALLDENPWFGGKIVVEPGRFLAGPCGVYLAKVVRVKESRGCRFVILEGGINHLLRPLLTGQSFPARAPGKEGPLSPCTLAGPLCTSLDRLGDAMLPVVRPGDLVMLGQAGAYGYTEAMGDFLLRPRPNELWI